MIHLHTHSKFSVGDALPSPDEYAKRAGEGSVLALTDHDTLGGMLYHQKACRKYGVKPIHGLEVSTVHGNLTLLCEDYTGLQNLFKIVSLEGKATYDDLSAHSKGIIALSGDLSSHVSTSILTRDMEELRTAVSTLADIYGSSFYFEHIYHGFKEQEEVIRNLKVLSKKLGVKGVATNDVHYLGANDADGQAVLMLDRFSKKKDLATLMWHIHREAWLKPMPKDLVAEEIAERCNVDIKFVQPKLPDFPVPKKFDSMESYLRYLSKDGLANRGLLKHMDRLNYELEVICSMDFAGYFLITWDFIKWAKDNGVPVGPGRGSGAGSLVAYALNITDVDPMKYDLLFERFMNPQRVSMPDFDIDFGQYKRNTVIQYVVNKYGEDDVSQIQTYGGLKARSAWKAAASVLRVNTQDSDAFSKMLPGQDNSLSTLKLKDIFDENGLVNSNAPAEYQKINEYMTKKRSNVIKIARKIEGAYKSIGTHAAGLIITKGRVVDNIPATRVEMDGVENLTRYTSQLDKYVVEEMGAIKFDFLGLSELDVIAYAVKNIKRKNRSFDLDEISFSDKDVYHMLSEGKTNGVFQFGSDGLSGYLMLLKPNCFMDLVAASSLYRPGPKDMGMHEEYAKRKNGLTPVVYLHDDLIPVLKDTYGIIVYQEQVIAIPQALAGYSLADADLLRRAVGKKDPVKMKQEQSRFIEGGVKNGYELELMETLWDQINAFARYGFNKSHAVAYSKISYQGAWLKFHYPAEFLAAQIQVRDFDQMISFVREAREDFGLKVNEPTVGKTRLKTREQNGEIWLGFQTVKSLGELISKKIEGKFFKDIFDFCINIEPNKRDFEALVYSGSLDCFFPGLDPQRFRADLIASSDILRSMKNTNQLQLFLNEEVFAMVSADEALSWSEMLSHEYKCLGRYRTGHPVDEFIDHSEYIGAAKINRVTAPNHFYTICAVITGFKEIKTKKGDLMCFIRVEDDTGEFDITVFPEEYAKNPDRFNYDDQPSAVKYISFKTNYRNDKIEGIFNEMGDA